MSLRWRVFAIVLGIAALAGTPCWPQGTRVARLADDIHDAELRLREPSMQNDGAAWWKLAMLYQDAARYADAERCYSRAVALLKDGDRQALANAMDSMGTMYVETGAYAQAEPLEKQALAMRESADDSIGVGRSWMHLAMLSLGEHDAPSAAKYAKMATQRLVYTGSSATPEEQMTSLIDLVLALCAEGRCQAAIAPLKEAHRLALANYGAGEFPAGYTDFLMGYTEWKSGNKDRAEQLMKSGTASIEAQLGWGHPTYIAVMTQYESFLEESGHFNAAAEVRSKLARIQTSLQASGQGVSTGNNVAQVPSPR